MRGRAIKKFGPNYQSQNIQQISKDGIKKMKTGICAIATAAIVGIATSPAVSAAPPELICKSIKTYMIFGPPRTQDFSAGWDSEVRIFRFKKDGYVYEFDGKSESVLDKISWITDPTTQGWVTAHGRFVNAQLYNAYSEARMVVNNISTTKVYQLTCSKAA